MWAVGLMTGTVLDGNIDVALLRCNGDRVDTFGPDMLIPYRASTLELLRQSLDEAQAWQFGSEEPAVFAEAQRQLTLEQSEAVLCLLEKAGLKTTEVGVVGFHGQTVLHRAPTALQLGATRQLGDGALMAEHLGIDVVHDFRSADMRGGGQGAPLCAIYHRALLEALGTDGDTAVLNLGGVANLSFWDGADKLIAFDTGPANAPINDFVKQHGNADFDRDGLLARTGQVDELQLAKLLTHPYLYSDYPKSLDRFDFSASMAAGCALEDGCALLTAFAAAAVGAGLDLLPFRPERLVVCGGGRHNKTLMRELAKRTGVQIVPAEQVGWVGDALEAQCFAYLAVRVINSMPTSFPSTTGVRSATVGGVVNRV